MAKRKTVISVTYGPKARVYTYDEVQDIIANERRKFVKDLEEKAAILAEADKADAERILHVIYLYCLNKMGLQRAGLIEFQQRIVDACEAINQDGELYAKMREHVEGVLGYELHDFDLQDELDARIEEVKRRVSD